MLFLWILALAARVLADVAITSPASGSSFSGSSGTASFTVKWNDDGVSDDTALTGVSKYAVVLCTGPNNNIKSVLSLSTSVSSSSTSYSASIEASAVPDGYYFVQVYASFTAGGYTIHYSPRFELTDMSGSTGTVTFSASLLSITGTNPSPQTALGTDTGDADATYSRSHTVSYQSQTGRTRYAPMQTQPGKSISYSTWSNRNPTSAYTPYTSISPSPNVYSTVTGGWDYAVTSSVNTAAVAPYPTYYYPASERVQQASLTERKKRWI